MVKTLRELAEHVGGTVIGDETIRITAVAGIEDAQEGQLTFLANPKYHKELNTTKASAALVAPGVEVPEIALIQVPNPYVAFAQILPFFSQKYHPPVGIHASSLIGAESKLGEQCAVADHVSVGNHVRIGKRVMLYPGVVIGDHVTIGDDTILYPNVSVLQDVTIGSRVIVNSGTVIGSEGFGFAPLPDGSYAKIPQIGAVIIENDVEIGANVTIDRATLGATHIKQGVKIDNLVQIAHNVVIGEHSVIVAQVGISGSSKIGKHVTLAGQTGVVGHIQIGDHVMVGAQSGITKSIPEQAKMSGSPAVEHSLWRKSQVALLRLPEALKTIRALEQRLHALEEALSCSTKELS